MNRMVLIACCLWNAVATAQPHLTPLAPGGIPHGGLDLCEINCTCSPKPGEVDKCSVYWTFKSGPGGSIVRVVNPDPNACTTAVNANVTALTTHFGKGPEVSLPTKEMATQASTFAPPSQSSLPYSRLLDTAAPVVLNDPLDVQISAETVRVLALTEDARSYGAVGGAVSQWQSASAASKRIIAKVEGAEKSLSLAKPWPELREFAPMVWDLRICTHSKPAEVADLASRIANKDDLAWNFAFLDDWIVLQSAFNATSGAPAGTGTSSFETILRPFFAEPATRVKERTEKSLFTLLELRTFRSAVTTASTAIDSYSQDLNGKAKARRDELEKAISNELAAVTRIREVFSSEVAAVAKLKSAVEATVAEKGKVQASINSTNSEISSNTSSLQSRTSQRDQHRQARSSAQAALTSKRTAVDEAQAMLQSVELHCGDKPYDVCPDQAAKKDYDKRRYEANKAVAVARSALVKAQADLQQADGDLLVDDKAILELRGNIASMRTRLKALQVARESVEKNLVELGEKLQAGEVGLSTLTGLSAKLDEAVVALGKARPS
ncbi:hypothetical protein [Roseateles flavus]|uniref:Uncharacterized protein n=1 Tax=Roseateles flavus TaxID=3149041 RepID=A0ABV0GGB6_9BURK